MSSYEMATIIVSVLAFAMSIIAILVPRKFSKESNLVAMGEAEMHTRDQINDICRDFEQMAEKIGLDAKLSAASLDSVLERYLNTYDEACQRYLDGKVDRERFEKSYSREIRRLVENENFKKRYDSTSTPYSATVKVYKKWFHEK